jgi:hypothetical protein
VAKFNQPINRIVSRPISKVYGCEACIYGKGQHTCEKHTPKPKNN